MDIASALLEVVAHTHPGTVPDLKLLTLEIDEDKIMELDFDQLSEASPDWFRSPYSRSTAEIGNEWLLSQESLGLIVPSSMTKTMTNLIINPLHSEFKSVEVVSIINWDFDPRLTK